jgi:hypothetical protein
MEKEMSDFTGLENSLNPIDSDTHVFVNPMGNEIDTKQIDLDHLSQESASDPAGRPLFHNEIVDEIDEYTLNSPAGDDLILPAPSFINIKNEKKLFIKELKIWWAEVQGREEFEIWVSQQPFSETNPGHHYLDVKNNSYTTRVTSYSPGIYYFRVRARGQGRTGHWSKIIEVCINVSKLQVQAQKGNVPGSIRVSWKAIEGALAYEICGITNNQAPQNPVKVEGTSILYEKLTPGHYQYQVRPIFSGGKGDWEKPRDKKAIIVPEPLRSAPRYLNAVLASETKISLSWTPVEGAMVDGYRIEADLGKGRFELISPTKYKLKSLPTQMTAELQKMPPGNHSFRVCAFNFSGSGPWSNVEKLMIQGDVSTKASEEPPLPIDKETLLIELGGLYDWGFAANAITDIALEKRLRVEKYILQEKQAGDVFRTRGEYKELLRPYLNNGREYRYAIFDIKHKLLAVVSFSIDRQIYQQNY